MRIRNLVIGSANFEKQIRFYSKVLSFDLVERTDAQAVFKIGESTLTLRIDGESTPCHFAFNIPCNQVREALHWLKERVEILKDDDREVQDFDSWNAEAIYFYDEDKNIVEFIARKNLDNGSNGDFGSSSILEISEIGVPVSSIEPVFKMLNTRYGLEIFDGNLQRFCAIGDEHGLFICINKHVKDWFPNGDRAYSSWFEIDFFQIGDAYKLVFENGRLKMVGD